MNKLDYSGWFIASPSVIGIRKRYNKITMRLNMETTGQHKLYSITHAAREMHIGKDTLYRLINEGKIGIIKIGKREKIPVLEIVKFQSENLMRRIPESKVKEILIPQTSKSRSKEMFKMLKQEMLNGQRL